MWLSSGGRGQEQQSRRFNSSSLDVRAILHRGQQTKIGVKEGGKRMCGDVNDGGRGLGRCLCSFTNAVLVHQRVPVS